VRTGLTLHNPTNAGQRGENAASLGGRPTGSCRVERHVDEFRRSFAMLKALGNYAQRQRLDTRDRFVAILAVRQDARESGHFRDPAAVVFALDFNGERHAGNVPSGPDVQVQTAATMFD
jgi:hypothetical protein